LATLRAEPPAQLAKIEDHLRLLQDKLDIEDMEVAVWSAGQDYLDRLGYQLRFFYGQISPSELLAEIDATARDALFVTPQPPPPRQPPADLTEAREELRAALRADSRLPASQKRLRQAQQDFDRRLEEELIQPLLRPTASPRKRNLQVALMHVSRLAHRLGPLMDEELAQISPLAVLRGADAIPKNQLNQLTALVRMLMALTRELQP
jgi:hypothetical protein